MDVVRASAHAARIEVSEHTKDVARTWEAGGSAIAAENMWRAIESVMVEHHCRGLAEELQGWCVFCSHTMGLERLKAFQLQDTGAAR
jgi:hypothetical protein